MTKPIFMITQRQVIISICREYEFINIVSNMKHCYI
uniref:Uncharacterized protein n=1 Tax=Anguilla anguilla TaxID=7936 RepID=A0A0E9PPE3_ANGAN